MSTSWVVRDVMQNEAVYFGLFGLSVAGLALYMGYVIRRWSWIPRRKQRKCFTERW